VHLPDGTVRGEPALSLRYRGPLAWCPALRPRDPFDDGVSDPLAEDVGDWHDWTTPRGAG
jgi:hypothetical protein